MNVLMIDGESYQVVKTYFKGYINRPNYDHPERSNRGFCFLVEAINHLRPGGALPVNVYAAALPLSARSWKQFDGQAFTYAGDSSWTFTLCNGQDYDTTENNRWTMTHLRQHLFRVTWEGHITNYADAKIHFYASAEVPFSGVSVTEAKSRQDACNLLAHYFDSEDFELLASPPANEPAESYFFMPK
jgi:hypothetical protein